jgi:hypothetical protein
MARADRTGLSLGYRIGWRLRYAAVSVFGPAQLGTDDDPQMRLRREKREKVEAAHRARNAHPAA